MSDDKPDLKLDELVEALKRGVPKRTASGDWALLYGEEEVIAGPEGLRIASMVRDALRSGEQRLGGVAQIYLSGRMLTRVKVPPMQGEIQRRRLNWRVRVARWARRLWRSGGHP